MTNEKLSKHWNAGFPDCLPIAYELKNKFSKRWLRIHALPESKRYADNEKEYAEILRRHNFILSDLFDADHSFVLLSKGYGLNINVISEDKKLKVLGLQKNFWLSINVSDETDEENYFWNLFYDEIKWRENSFNNLLRLVADDEINEIMFFSIENNIIYHPYDGGADIILKDSILRDKYKEKYRDWLSNHPKGL